MQPNKSVEEIKCRRCGMLLKNCPRKRWTNPLCVVDGAEWDEHVIGLSDLASHTNTVLQGVVERVGETKTRYRCGACDGVKCEHSLTCKAINDTLSLLNDQIISNEEKKETWKTKVGMLRQWLNEDRITDPQKMVTNEQIIKWLE